MKGAPATPPLEDLQPLVVDEPAARATLRAQLRHLERELAQLSCDRFADPGDREPFVPAAAHHAAPRLLSFAELEAQRDGLVARVAELRAQRRARRAEIQEVRGYLEEVRRAPKRHKFVRIPRAALGEPGCGVYQVKPRLGIIGMLAGWWQVKLSSGCP